MKDGHYVYKTGGRVCASEIAFDIVEGRIYNITFQGGCTGNTSGVSLLAEGMPVEDVVKRLKGVQCHNGTSCPNELAQAIEQAISEQEQ